MTFFLQDGMMVLCRVCGEPASHIIPSRQAGMAEFYCGPHAKQINACGEEIVVPLPLPDNYWDQVEEKEIRKEIGDVVDEAYNAWPPHVRARFDETMKKAREADKDAGNN